MTKAEIVQVIYGRLGGFSKKEAADLVDLVFETMKETLARGEKIKVSGFGNFVLRDKRQRQGRNPQTGDPIVITQRRVLSFKASQILKQGLNPKKSSNGSHADGVSTPPHAAGNVAASNVPTNGHAHGSAPQSAAPPQAAATQAAATASHAHQSHAHVGHESNATHAGAPHSAQQSASHASAGATAPDARRGRAVTFED